LWGDRCTYSPEEFRTLITSAARLLEQRRALGALVFEGGTPRAFGLSTFAAEPFMDGFLTDPHPQIGRRLLQDGAPTATSNVLDLSDIARGNCERGLELVVLNTAYDPGSGDPGAVVGELMAAFQRVHRGYRIARITNEVFGDAAINIVTSSASYQVRRIFDIRHPKGHLRSALATLTRSQAAQWNTPLLSMFVYNPPSIVFTPAQRDLLQTALGGLTDNDLADQLGLRLTTIKATWTRIYQRAFQRAPHLFATVRTRDSGSARGVQVRHLLLQHVRNHPEELTPYELLDQRIALPDRAYRREGPTDDR